jgi:hypothetical protein
MYPFMGKNPSTGNENSFRFFKESRKIFRNHHRIFHLAWVRFISSLAPAMAVFDWKSVTEKNNGGQPGIKTHRCSFGLDWELGLSENKTEVE